MEWEGGDLSIRNLKRLGILGSYRPDLDFVESVETKVRRHVYDLVSPKKK